jgi:hypothetical protein
MVSATSKPAPKKQLKAFDRLEIVTDFDNAENARHCRPPPGFEHTKRIGMGWRIVSVIDPTSHRVVTRGNVVANSSSRLGSASIQLDDRNRIPFRSTHGVATASGAKLLQR